MTALGCLLALGLSLPLAAAAPGHVDESVDVNSAVRAQIEALPGIGDKVAGEIVRERDENGGFQSLEDLQARIPSLTAAMLKKAGARLKIGPVEPPPGSSTTTATTPGSAAKLVTAADARAVLAKFAAEPSVRAVQDAAVDYVRAHPDIVDSWQSRARIRAAAPQLTAQAEAGVDDSLRKVTNLDATAAEIDSGNNQNSGKVIVTARWDLDRLVFEPEELNVARESVRAANLRDRVLEEVTRRYFERRRLQVDLELSPPTDLAERVKKELRLQELTAGLDAFTGGFFSEELARSEGARGRSDDVRR